LCPAPRRCLPASRRAFDEAEGVQRLAHSPAGEVRRSRSGSASGRLTVGEQVAQLTLVVGAGRLVQRHGSVRGAERVVMCWASQSRMVARASRQRSPLMVDALFRTRRLAEVSGSIVAEQPVVPHLKQADHR
jgi:hypothetical protein